jgi:heme/copper-type cytochrome/quinol oxidase subunit 3
VINIPYASEPRPDTGVTNATLGMWLFIASEVMLFGSLFSSYALLRIGAPTWPDQSATLNVGLATVNTVILIASSVAILRASRAAAEGAIRGFRQAMAITVLCGIGFLAIKAVEYRGELLAGLLPATNNFIGLYFTLTGLHALHVAAGLVVNGHLWVSGAALARTDASRFTSRVQMAALYWNFIDLVWITMFVVLYLL